MSERSSLPYSHIFEERLSEMERSVNRMIKDNLDQLPGVKSAEIEDDGDGEYITITVIMNNKKKFVKKEKRHVDESALELPSYVLESQWGLGSKEAAAFAEELDSPKQIKKLEPTVYKQLRREYILNTLPHDNGGEFLDQDKEMIMSLIEEAS